MSIPTSEPILPQEEPKANPPRHRRVRRYTLPETSDERAARLKELALQLTPTFDLFLFTLVTGLILILAILFDAPGLYVLAALFVPFLGPVLGISLSAVLGSASFFLQSLAATLVGGLVMFLAGIAAGLASRLWPELAFHQAQLHALFTWPDLLVLTLGAGFSTLMLLRSPRQKPLIPNVALGYELFLPVGVAGFGLLSDTPGLFPQGLFIFGVHLLCAILVGIAVMAASRFRPANSFGYVLGGLVLFLCLVSLFFIGGLGTVVGAQTNLPIPIMNTPIPKMTSTATPSPTATSIPATRTPTPTQTNTLVPSLTPSKTVTPKPTPIWAKVWVEGGDGALIRAEPDSKAKIVGSVLNGGPIQVISDPVTANGTTWVRVLTENNIEGWIVQGLLVTATPAPNW